MLASIMECIHDPVRDAVGSNPDGRVIDRQVLPREAPARARPRPRRRRKRKRIPGCHACRSAVRAFWVDRPARGPFRSFYLSPRGPQRGVVCPEALSERGWERHQIDHYSCLSPGGDKQGLVWCVLCACSVRACGERAGLARTRGRRRERMHAERIACVRTSGLILLSTFPFFRRRGRGGLHYTFIRGTCTDESLRKSAGAGGSEAGPTARPHRLPPLL